MKYPIEKYTIITHQHPDYAGVETIAFSTYAGKPVYGKAICRVEDTYDEQFGRDVAVARCAAKIAKKRLKRASKMCREADAQIKAAMQHGTNMEHYYKDALAEVKACEEAVAKLMNKIQ